MRYNKMKWTPTLKGLLTALIALLVLYAPAELTRVIILQGLDVEYILEIAFIWVFYIAAIAIVFKLIGKE